MTGVSRCVLMLTAAVLTAAAGCVRISETPQAPRSFSLLQAQVLARKKHLEAAAFSVVQQQAAEFSSSEKKIYIHELLREQNSSVQPESISRMLEDAICGNHLLGGVEPGADLVKIQSVRSGQLLDFATASAAVQLGTALQLYDLGIAEARQEIHSAEMELRNLTGAAPQDLARLNLSKLPKPHPLKEKLITLQQFAAFNRPESKGTLIYPELLYDIKQFYRNDSRLLLLYAADLYHFQTALNKRKEVNAALFRRTSRLANAVGIALQVELDVQNLNRAYDACRLLELKLQLSKNPPQEVRAEALRLTRQWHLAWLKLRADIGMTDFDLPLPVFPEQSPPELTAETALLFELLAALAR